MIASKTSNPVSSLGLCRALLLAGLAVLTTQPVMADESERLDRIEEWLQQGVGSAIMTQQEASIMLGALRDNSDAIDALVREQVMEGMNLAAMAKASVAETWLRLAVAAADRSAARMTADPYDTQGKYVASIDVIHGEILITYGKESYAGLAGSVLVLTPYATDDGAIVWQCGLSTYGNSRDFEPIGNDTGNSATTVESRYLPNACRE